jgi:hypothetical protein
VVGIQLIHQAVSVHLDLADVEAVRQPNGTRSQEHQYLR